MSHFEEYVNSKKRTNRIIGHSEIDFFEKRSFRKLVTSKKGILENGSFQNRLLRKWVTFNNRSFRNRSLSKNGHLENGSLQNQLLRKWVTLNNSSFRNPSLRKKGSLENGSFRKVFVDSLSLVCNELMINQLHRSI